MTKRNGNWPIIILSLAGDDTRRAPLLDSLDALSLPYEVFLGIDGRNGLSSNLLKQIDRSGAEKRLGRPMTDGEFACALSHREIYLRILNQDWDGAVVLEDDAIIGAQFEAFIQQKLYLKAPLLMLDHSHARVWGKATALLPDVQMRPLSMSSSLATAYSISKRAAKSLIDSNTPIRGLADWPCDLAELEAAVVVPQIVGHPHQHIGVSHLRDERVLVAKKNRLSTRERLLSLSRLAFWKSWITKRLSRRVS